MKLTKRALDALRWMAENEPVHLFPAADPRCPNMALRKRFQRDGLIAVGGVEPGRWGFSRFVVTDAGYALLQADQTDAGGRS